MPSSGRGSRGFTLLETMVSLAVLSVAAIAVWNVLAMASRAGQQDADTRVALMLADTTLTKLSLVPVKQLGRQTGRFDGQYQRYQWVCDVESSPFDGLVQVVVRVCWQQRGQQRSVTLATLLRV
jgi:type II secretion system protein I